MMIISSLLLSGMIAGELIATNCAFFIPVNHGTTELRPVISTATYAQVSSFECTDHCDETVMRTGQLVR